MPKPSAALIDGHTWRYARQLPGTAQELWPWVTSSSYTEKWFGPFTYDAASSVAAVTMTAEAEGGPMEMKVAVLEPPTRLVLDSGVWVIELQVSDGEIALQHAVAGPEEAASVGPGWEFYMDRLAAAVTGGSVADINFESDYFPALSEYFVAGYASQ